MRHWQLSTIFRRNLLKARQIFEHLEIQASNCYILLNGLLIRSVITTIKQSLKYPNRFGCCFSNKQNFKKTFRCLFFFRGGFLVDNHLTVFNNVSLSTLETIRFGGICASNLYLMIDK